MTEFQRQSQELITTKISDILNATDDGYDEKLTAMLERNAG